MNCYRSGATLGTNQMTVRIDPVADYILTGIELEHIVRVSEKLNDLRSLTWDERRDLANLLNLVVMRAYKFEPRNDQ